MSSRSIWTRGTSHGDAEQLRRLLTETARLEKLQATLLGHITEGVLLQDATGRVLSSNPAARALLGLPAERLHGRRALISLSATDADGTPLADDARPTAATITAAEGITGRIIGLSPADGRARRWVSVTTDPVFAPSGDVEYVVSSMRDITEQHAAVVARRHADRAREDRVRQLLTKGGPIMVAQPIVDLPSGTVVGVEALARFPQLDPAKGPEEWFADAAASGLGLELELAAIAHALPLLEQLPDPVYLSINASPTTVASPRLLTMLADSPANRLVLELTEHVAVTDYTALAEPLNRLRWAGVRLAVDDAGSGFASLQHVLNIAPDIIKLDRALVAGIDTDPARASLTTCLVAFAERIGAELVAEGIETPRELDTLRALGIRRGQGFLLGRPRSAAALTFDHPTHPAAPTLPH